MTDFGSQKGAQREPKSTPKRTKIEDKNRCEKNTSSRSSWGRLGAILGHFGSPLGVIFIDFLLVFKAFRENSRFSKNSVSRAVLSPTWPILGRFWPPKRLQDAPQERPKTIKKNDQKNDRFLARKWASTLSPRGPDPKGNANCKTLRPRNPFPGHR